MSSTDGVGTKLLVAVATGRFDTIGIDLVAMCVDDVAVQGADPLLFLDYIAIGAGRAGLVEALVAGMADGCRQAGCALVGGEVAEHGDGHPLELAGFAVGVVERAGILTGAPSGRVTRCSGCPRPGCAPTATRWPDGCCSVTSRPGSTTRPGRARATRWPTSCCCRPSSTRRPWPRCGGPSPCRRSRTSRAGAAGQPRPRAAGGLRRRHRAGLVAGAPIFGEIQRRGDVADDEMARVFNLGLGMLAVVPSEAVGPAQDVLAARGGSYVVGHVVAGERTVTLA